MTTTRVDITGANAGQKKRRCAWSTAYSSTVSPYIGTCTAKTTTKNRTASTDAWPRSSARTPATGPASAASTRPSGVSTRRVQPSAAPTIRSTATASRRTTGPASNGTSAPARAPPAATSNRTFGSTFAEL